MKHPVRFFVMWTLVFVFIAAIGICAGPLLRHQRLAQTNPFYFHEPSAQELLSWVHMNITYVSDLEAHGFNERYQSPKETLDAKRGDCEDMAILFVALVEHHFALKLDFAVCRMPDGSLHMCAFYADDDLILDPTGGFFAERSNYPGRVEQILPHEEVMNYASSLGRFFTE